MYSSMNVLLHPYLSKLDIKCELDKTATRDETRELTNEEFLFQCERDSGIFLALCTQDVTVNCTEIDQETQAGKQIIII